MKATNQLAIPTVTGTFLSVLPNLTSDDIIKTIILAAVGAAVSFLMSLFLKVIFRKHNPK